MNVQFEPSLSAKSGQEVLVPTSGVPTPEYITRQPGAYLTPESSSVAQDTSHTSVKSSSHAITKQRTLAWTRPVCVRLTPKRKQADEPAVETGEELLTRRRLIWATALSFKQVVSSSPIVKSALTAIELRNEHPVDDFSNATGLKWTLASMLALHVKVALNKGSACSASAASVLASLWILQSMFDSDCSEATPALRTYLQCLAVYDRPMAASIVLGWDQEFKELRKVMVENQLNLLQGINWKSRLDFNKDIFPCFAALFLNNSSSARLLHGVTITGGQGVVVAAAENHARRAAQESAVTVEGKKEPRSEWIFEWDALCNYITSKASYISEKCLEQKPKRQKVF